jgi:N-methylhydantoinase A/oxoprolinase/acetone carboxylase beta subunit
MAAEGGVGGEHPSGNVSVRRYRIGVDIGGTFTDFVLLDMRSGCLECFKLTTTTDDPSVAVFQGLESIRDRFDVTPAQVEVVVHATTLATNILIERKGAAIGVITTEGFRDVLEMRRETRYDDLDLAPEFPPPLAPRHVGTHNSGLPSSYRQLITQGY